MLSYSAILAAPTAASQAARASVRKFSVHGLAGVSVRAVLGAVGRRLVADEVLVLRARQLVRAEGVELDAVLAEGVLHPVPVHGLEVVERLRLVQEVGVPLRGLRARDVVRLRGRRAEHRAVLVLRDRQRRPREVGHDQRDLPLLDRRLDARVGVVRPGQLLVVVPRQLVLPGPVLRIERRRRGVGRERRRAERQERRHPSGVEHLHLRPNPSVRPAASCRPRAILPYRQERTMRAMMER